MQLGLQLVRLSLKCLLCLASKMLSAVVSGKLGIYAQGANLLVGHWYKWSQN